MPWWLWVLLGALALAGEAASMALFLLNVGISAFIAALLALAGAGLAAQLAAFVVVSVLLIGLVRPQLLRRLTGAMPPPPLPEQEAPAGRVATVTETVTDEGGAIRVGRAEFWSARPDAPSTEFTVGSRVRVTHVKGVTAFVDALPTTSIPSEISQDEEAEPGDITTIQPRFFAELLRRHRLAAGLTQEELAERANVSVRAVSALERGVNHTPRRDTVELLAQALALSPEECAAFREAARGRVPR